MTLELHAQAARELSETMEWYETRRHGLGADFLREMSRAFDSILESPRTWQVWPGWRSRIKVRRFVLSRFPFSVAYAVFNTERVVVLAVAHARRRPGYWRKRLEDF